MKPKPTSPPAPQETPRLRAPDSAPAFLREGYTFISSRCDRLGADLFRTRIAGRPVVCMRGADAARVFYEGDRFTRRGALPPTVVHLLQDRGSVQTLDGAGHRHRKAMFLDIMNEASVAELVRLFEKYWRQRSAGWQGRTVVLHREVRIILTAAACEWAVGLPLQEAEVEARAAEFGLMVDQAGSFGPANWWAQLRRRRTERWAGKVISRIRSGAAGVPSGAPAAVIAGHREANGELLPEDVAAVELLNVIRPVVAVDRFIAFAGTALVEHPEWRARFAAADAAASTDLGPFAQEVRRYYPFFPAVGGVVRKEFTWNNHTFTPGNWVLLDIYGTNHDAALWPDPEAFHPERFRTWNGDPNTLIPQGGGQAANGHRCPGEGITLELVKSSVLLLARSPWKVPAQDLTISLSKLPSIPRSGLLLTPAGPTDVRP